MLSGINASWSYFGGSILAWGIIAPSLVKNGLAFGVPVSDEFPAPFNKESALEELIPHLTSRPARRLGLIFDPVSGETGQGRIPRGLIKEGYATTPGIVW